jgi:GH15 family glucan-1,4-alpha-glucosidase
MSDPPDLNLALIGNCTYSALVDRQARIVWACFPRFDGDPIFCSLLNGTKEGKELGVYEIALVDFSHSEQQYITNTAILVTTLYDTHGGVVEVTDFAPRYRHFGRLFFPTTLVRQIRCVRGAPRIRLRIRPTYHYGAGHPDQTRGSNHIRFITPDMTLRLTTTAPVSYIVDEVPFLVEDPIMLILGPDESLTRSIEATGQEFFERTLDYWQEFSRYLSIPFEWQRAVIRASITLKLCSFDESGAVVAAVTTSIPEAPDSGRNWDYRYCWLRDAYFVVHALNRLGATGTLERYLRYISNLAAGTKDGYLQPVYGITLESRLTEREVESLGGYRGMAPVRVGNAAYEQVQNDGYGSVILAVTHAFFDRRLARPGTVQLFEVLEEIGEQAVRRFDQPDAGLWELRSGASVHTFSSVMCWAACDRLAKIARRLELPDRIAYWTRHAEKIRSVIMDRAWNEALGHFVATFDGTDVDASLLLLHDLRFVDAHDPKFVGTVAAIERVLRRDDRIYRYTEDEFGAPEVAFTVCTFWYIDALVPLVRREEARELFESLLNCRNHVGLLSEDIAPNGELWGNFPQTYSMVGLINSAMRLSRTWEEAY